MYPVLVVDDYPINRMVAAKQLESLGLGCDVAADGRDGLERFQAGRYALVLTDLSMPVMDGYEFAKACRAFEEGTGRRTPIAAMSADCIGPASRCANECGFDEILPKPVKLDDLTTLLARLIPAGEAAEGGMAPECPETGNPVNMKRLKAQLGGLDEEEIAETLGMFALDFASLLGELRRALDAGDRAAIRGTAHKAKGGAGIVAAEPLTETMTSIQSGAADESIEYLETLLGRAEIQFERVRSFIQTLPSGGNRP